MKALKIVYLIILPTQKFMLQSINLEELDLCLKTSLNITKQRNILKKIKEFDFHLLPQEDQIEARLNKSLKTLCLQMNIPLSYKDELGDAAGKILYHSKGGRLILDDARIEILTKHENMPYVLAHELGHYMAIKQRSDNSEEGADNEAYMLCKSFLTDEEYSVMKRILDIYFHRSH